MNVVQELIYLIEQGIAHQHNDPNTAAAYAALKALLRARFEAVPRTLFNRLVDKQIMDTFESDPQKWRGLLETHLNKINLTEDADLLTAADDLAEALSSAAEKPAAPPAPPPLKPRNSGTTIQQNIGTMTGGTVIGQQHNAYTAPPERDSQRPSEREQPISSHPRLRPDPQPPAPTGGHVFLSYSRTDTEVMKRLRDDLRELGLLVWTDETLTPGTPSWKKSIEAAIEGAGAVVVILSPDSKISQWVEAELDYARAQNVMIFPVLARGDEKSAVPFGLNSMQRVDIRSGYIRAVQALADSIQQHLGG